jgi:hypothetical protein
MTASRWNTARLSAAPQATFVVTGGSGGIGYFITG